MSLTEYLTWNGPEAGGAEYRAAFNRKAEARLVAAVAEVQRQACGDRDLLIQIMEDLPSDSVLRLAYEPELEYRLRGTGISASGAAALAHFLYERASSELRLQGPAPVPDSPSALDARVGPGIPIDFDGPYNRGDLANRFPSHASHTFDERAAVAHKLRQAFALIRASGEEVTGFVIAFTQVIVPLRIDVSGAWFGSFSSSWYPGRNVLVNAQSPDMLVWDVAAALVHEAIHSLVDVSELEGQLLVAGRPHDRRVRSPWTGAVISLQSLVDAYFVWYGLLHFWRAVARSQPRLSAICDRYVEMCRAGFRPTLGLVIGQDGLDAVHEVAKERIEDARCRANALPGGKLPLAQT